MGRPLLRQYLEGYWFITSNEHDALKWILKLTDCTGRLAQLLPQFSKFNFEVVHSAGIKHRAADTISRLVSNDENTIPRKDDVPPLAVDARNHETTLMNNDKFSSP